MPTPTRHLRFAHQLAAAALLGALAAGSAAAIAAQSALVPPRCAPPSIPVGRETEPAGRPPAGGLTTVAEIPLPGPAVRFDYQSLDTVSGRLYLSHMHAGEVVVVDTRTRRVTGVVRGLPGVTGVWAVPELNRVYASATGLHRVAIIDSRSDTVIARVGPIGFPDGIAFVPGVRKVYVSDEAGGGELVIDAAHDRVVRTIPLGGEAGNTIYDAGSGCVLVAVQTRNEVVAIEPASDRVVGRYPVPGASHPHGLSVDPLRRLLFIAGEGNATLAVMDLRTMRVTAHYPIGADPDVLAFDPGWRRLYVAAEGGPVTVFEERGDTLVTVTRMTLPHGHTVSVAAATHLIYFPLQDVGGRPVLRIMSAAPAASPAP